MKDQLRILISLLMTVILGFLFPVRAEVRSASGLNPDLPMPRLLEVASADIDNFWLTNFSQAGRRYVTPTLVPYAQQFMTPCGVAVLNNAFYCPASNSIYFDANFLYRFYRNVGDYAAVIIIAHEWGHLVQAQSGISRGRYFTIQMELQADCFAGSYTKHAEQKKELEPGDLEEAGVGLFSGGDPRGMPWFSPQAHGSSTQRINAFLNGYRGGRCLGSW